MSKGHQAKISQSSWRNSMSMLSYAGSKFTAMEVVFCWLRGMNPNFFRVLGCVESLI
jgi:hypothetical protein